MRFVGGPGTGKTTVARVIGKIFKENGILQKGGFFEYSGRNLCGRYVGETAPKTAGICRDAYGSVLFIDEAYSLYRTDSSGVDYGREALDTLIAEMENHRADLVVIMAGYSDEMNDLMQGNRGLESRMPYVIEFPNYDREELAEIFFRMAEEQTEFDDSFRKAVSDYFANISDEVLKSKNFSNARFVRNLFERTCAKSGMRKPFAATDKIVLDKEDFLLACSDNVFSELLNKKPKYSIGFHLNE
jgi:SpoVK/Ycf46/Vps4 family AAA+-type ATPase